ncbi:CsgG/HfaB family protein [Seleniivibrio woodruffii]|nr:CsgG/HfaB family protein [Seleniivibrio woodruffii]
MSYQISPADAERIEIPNVCRASYKIEMPRVAVVEFANNTTYGEMTATNTNIDTKGTRKSVSAGAVGVVAAPGAAGIGYVGANRTDVQVNTQIDTFQRQFSSKVGEYAQSAVENTISKMGGTQMFDRKKLDKILSEQKFQMTMADPATAVKLGKMAGVQYIITGSVDNIATKYIEKIDNNNNVGGGLGAALSIGTALANTQTGWNVNVEMTVQLLDVESGQIIISQKATGREVAGTARNFNPEMALTAAKKALGEAVDDIRPLFSEKFAQKGYIQQLRGNKKVALVNIGSEKGIQSGQKLEVFDFLEIVDPMTNASSCNMSVIPVDITVSDQVQPGQSWVLIDGKPEVTARLKVGSIIQRKKLEGQSVFKKMF